MESSKGTLYKNSFFLESSKGVTWSWVVWLVPSGEWRYQHPDVVRSFGTPSNVTAGWKEETWGETPLRHV